MTEMLVWVLGYVGASGKDGFSPENVAFVMQMIQSHIFPSKVSDKVSDTRYARQLEAEIERLQREAVGYGQSSQMETMNFFGRRVDHG